MSCRYRWFTIAAVSCQLVFAFLLLTNGLRVRAQDLPPLSADGPSQPASYSKGQGEEATIRAVSQEKHGDVWTLRGNAEIDYKDLILHADQIPYTHSTADALSAAHT